MTKKEKEKKESSNFYFALLVLGGLFGVFLFGWIIGTYYPLPTCENQTQEEKFSCKGEGHGWFHKRIEEKQELETDSFPCNENEVRVSVSCPCHEWGCALACFECVNEKEVMTISDVLNKLEDKEKQETTINQDWIIATETKTRTNLEDLNVFEIDMNVLESKFCFSKFCFKLEHLIAIEEDINKLIQEKFVLEEKK